jgi:hypothetical protein
VGLGAARVELERLTKALYAAGQIPEPVLGHPKFEENPEGLLLALQRLAKGGYGQLQVTAVVECQPLVVVAFAERRLQTDCLVPEADRLVDQSPMVMIESALVQKLDILVQVGPALFTEFCPNRDGRLALGTVHTLSWR